MGSAFRVLHWIWRRISDATTASDLLDFLDLKTATGAIVAGVAMSIFGATNYSWSPQAVVLAAIVAAACVAIIIIAIRLLIGRRESAAETQVQELDGNLNKFFTPTVTQSPPTLAAGLNVSDIRFTFDKLKKERHSELTFRVFNGTGHAIELDSFSGQIKFNAPNNTDSARMGTFPSPSLRHDVKKVVYATEEWFFIFDQHVPSTDADKLLAMRKANVPILFELTELDIKVFAQDERKKIERLPLWHGVSYSRDLGFGRIDAGVGNMREGPDT